MEKSEENVAIRAEAGVSFMLEALEMTVDFESLDECVVRSGIAEKIQRCDRLCGIVGIGVNRRV